MNSKIAIILIRGTVNTSPDVRKTLELLRLKKKHACVVIDDNEVSRGMLHKIKDYVAYGIVDEKTFKEMLDKRGELIGKAKLSEDKKVDSAKIAKEYFEEKLKLRDFETKYSVKPFFRLAPPVGGFERKGIKMPYAKGGVIGDRKEAIAELISKML